MFYEIKDLQSSDLYKLLIGSVLPRPIAWVGSKNKAGIANLAPYSFFTVASINPPVVAISVANKDDGSSKDSLANIRSAQCFSVSMVSHKNVKAMSITAELFDADVNEFEMAGLTEITCSKIDSVRCVEAEVSFECRLQEVKYYGDHVGAGNLVLADVVAIHVNDEIVDGFKIDTDKFDAVGRLAGANYTTIRDSFLIDDLDS